MERYVDKVAVVTGASSGIGATIAENLVKSGMKVVGLARRVDRMQTHADQLRNSGAKGTFYPVKCDLQVEEDILNAFEWITKNVGNVQILVNNAGVAFAGYLSDGNTEEWRKIFDVNVLALCITTREAVKVMKANQIEGHIININSIDGHQHMYVPQIGVNSSCNHATVNLTEILRREMVEQKTNIKVSSVSPGLVNTDIVANSNFSDDVVKMFCDVEPLEPQDIADALIYILGAPRRVQINEVTLRSLNSIM